MNKDEIQELVDAIEDERLLHKRFDIAFDLDTMHPKDADEVRKASHRVTSALEILKKDV